MANEEQSLNIAVFDPTSSGTSIDDGTRIAIREIISSTIVNTGRHTIVERSLLEKVMQEQQFTNSGIVAESDATEIGKMAGANKIILSVVTLTGGRNMLSIKMIDVRTANVDRQQVKVVTSGELLDIVEPMTLKVIDVQSTATVRTEVAPPPAAAPQPTPSQTDPKPQSNKKSSLWNTLTHGQESPEQPAQFTVQSAGNENPEELYLKARSLYEQGLHGGILFKKSSKQRSQQQEAVATYTKAAELGHVEAQFCLYEIYVTGVITDRDPYESFKWLRKAAEGGHTKAQLILAKMYMKGDGLADKDPSQAIVWYERAANNGHNPSQILMGDAYWSGTHGLETNINKAIEWYEKAAAKNAKLAMEKGLIFEEGKVIAEDLEIAKRFYQLAVRQGETKGSSALERIEKLEAKRAKRRR